ncbi:MAG: hypothetical protein FJ109_05775 [Deltaproteobacteria bacterium]|nr:hypothetical protein [Deltaproteobacteria bacterium]
MGTFRSLVMCLAAALALSGAAGIPAAAAQDKPAQTMSDAEWKAFYAVYDKRADLASHKESLGLLMDLAARFPMDKKAQVLCAMTAYSYAHRLDDKGRMEAAKKGIPCAERILEQNKKDYEGRFWHAMTTFKAKSAEGIRAALKESTRVKKYLEDMIRDEPNRFEAYMLLGSLYRELPPVLTWGDPKKGLDVLEKGTALKPDDPEILLELAAAYAKVGQKDKAKATYLRCINDSKSPPDRTWETEDAREYARKMMKELGE